MSRQEKGFYEFGPFQLDPLRIRLPETVLDRDEIGRRGCLCGMEFRQGLREDKSPREFVRSSRTVAEFADALSVTQGEIALIYEFKIALLNRCHHSVEMSAV